MDAPEKDSAEHELITASLDLERLEQNLFRSRSLWLPSRARGVFGGQVISQALLSATNTVDPAYSVHSLHCYFLYSADASVPIVYHVETLRKGRSYTVCSVKAVQSGSCIFAMHCSFHRPELIQPMHQWPMPSDVPPPSACQLQEEVYEQAARSLFLSAEARERVLLYANDRRHSPIALKLAKRPVRGEGYDERGRTMYWLKARGVGHLEPSFHKCIVAYLSDLAFIGVAGKAMRLSNVAKPPNRLAMLSSLDHSIWFYDHNINCGDWLLHVIECPVGGSGRGLVHGRLYTQDGRLVAVTTQEGVVRADVDVKEEKAKL
ncbi:Thioesterase/thiol ester dehydrase-isomerase [Dacryopinax primogenitus]|uniref:Thioesterase/thiol ester dehydrase-isomerase n=1 Tax=Dacryopinax primogenitus (strain DJM 731) TaxID=1858805 RepID=M5GG64_DACPD|nr:Thioesterase/thiol ester dehydrase-isomerase [Dacryopinax primogenitus]EJU04943.1 Thioesterase/thiol ester dehydrase-isomerase [Dacryopinax primogenitus]